MHQKTCFNANLFRSKIRKIGSSPFSILKYVPPLDPANPLYCILIWYIDTTYVSGKLGPGAGGTYFKIENGDDPIFKIFDRK